MTQQQQGLGCLSIVGAIVVGFLVIGFGSCLVCAAVGAGAASKVTEPARVSTSGPPDPPPQVTATTPPTPEVWNGQKLSILRIENWCQEAVGRKLPQGATLPDLMDQDVLLGAKPSRGPKAARWRSYYLTSTGKKASFSCAFIAGQAPIVTLE
jgi:hypothetical protein